MLVADPLGSAEPPRDNPRSTTIKFPLRKRPQHLHLIDQAPHSCILQKASELEHEIDDWQAFSDEIGEEKAGSGSISVGWHSTRGQGSEIKKTRPCVILTSHIRCCLRITIVVVPLAKVAKAHPPHHRFRKLPRQTSCSRDRSSSSRRKASATIQNRIPGFQGFGGNHKGPVYNPRNPINQYLHHSIFSQVCLTNCVNV